MGKNGRSLSHGLKEAHRPVVVSSGSRVSHAAAAAPHPLKRRVCFSIECAKDLWKKEQSVKLLSIIVDELLRSTLRSREEFTVEMEVAAGFDPSVTISGSLWKVRVRIKFC